MLQRDCFTFPQQYNPLSYIALFLQESDPIAAMIPFLLLRFSLHQHAEADRAAAVQRTAHPGPGGPGPSSAGPSGTSPSPTGPRGGNL